MIPALLLAAAAAPPRLALTPARYRAAMAAVSSCQAFERRFAGLPYATPLLNTLFAEGIPDQKPSETGDDFVDRIVDRMFARLGDPSRDRHRLCVGGAGPARRPGAAGPEAVPRHGGDRR